MTYAQLIEELGKIPFDRLNDTVNVYDPDIDEFTAVNHMSFADSHNGVLDEGHAYIVLKSDGF
jgi:hypothetical protein